LSPAGAIITCQPRANSLGLGGGSSLSTLFLKRASSQAKDGLQGCSVFSAPMRLNRVVHRLNYQPLFYKGACAPSLKRLLRVESQTQESSRNRAWGCANIYIFFIFGKKPSTLQFLTLDRENRNTTWGYIMQRSL